MLRFDRSKLVSAFVTEAPHHGVSSVSGTAAITAGGFCFEDCKHAMLSYQWDSQPQVLSVREHLAVLGIPTWSKYHQVYAESRASRMV